MCMRSGASSLTDKWPWTWVSQCGEVTDICNGVVCWWRSRSKHVTLAARNIIGSRNHSIWLVFPWHPVSSTRPGQVPSLQLLLSLVVVAPSVVPVEVHRTLQFQDNFHNCFYFSVCGQTNKTNGFLSLVSSLIHSLSYKLTHPQPSHLLTFTHIYWSPSMKNI